jgi:acetyltransferase-like isoleucine patch superfamily enzyme
MTPECSPSLAEVSIQRNPKELLPEPSLRGLKNRILQELAQWVPGAFTLRVLLHRWRGVTIGQNVHIAYDVVIETAYPHWVFIGNNVQLGVRCMILAHLHALPPSKEEQQRNYISVRIEDDAYIGPGVIILPNVTIGRGSVVSAGSVVTRSIGPMLMAQGNPAKPIAECGMPLNWHTPYKEFLSRLRSLKP